MMSSGGALCLSATALGAALTSLVTGQSNEKAQLKRQLLFAQQLLEPISPPPQPYGEQVSRRASARMRQCEAQRRRNSVSAPTVGSNVRGFEDSGSDGPDLPATGWKSFSMEDARRKAEEDAQKALLTTPRAVLAGLQQGNARFWTGKAKRPEKNAFERRMLIMKQFPATAILGCSDSRVPTEIVFDQGLGDMFVVRVAGNFLDTATEASLQYSVMQLKVKVLVVMGHEGCGAVKAALQPPAGVETDAPMLGAALQKIQNGLDEDRLNLISDFRARDREAVVANVRNQVNQIAQCKCIATAVRSNELILVGAFYEISSGIVDFFLEVSADTLSAESATLAKALVEVSNRKGIAEGETEFVQSLRKHAIRLPDWPFPPMAVGKKM